MCEFHKQLEKLACPAALHRQDCHCGLLHDFYGQGLFKCNEPLCGFSRHGFRFKSEREKHQKQHERAFKCSQNMCDFAAYGFSTQQQLDQHIRRCHFSEPLEDSESLLIELVEPLDLFQALEDAIKAGRLSLVKPLTDGLQLRSKKLPPQQWTSLLELAIEHDSIDIPKYLFRLYAESEPQSALSYQIDPIEYAITYALSVHRTGLTFAARIGSLELIEWFIENGADPRYSMEGPTEGKFALNGAAYFARAEVVNLLLPHHSSAEANLAFIQLLKGEDLDTSSKPWLMPSNPTATATLLLRHGVTMQTLVNYKPLHCLVSGRCDTVLGQMLIDLGISPDEELNGMAALKQALSDVHYFPTSKASEFVKFLLQAGADPTLRACGDFHGAHELEAELGVTWDELVYDICKVDPALTYNSDRQGLPGRQRLQTFYDRIEQKVRLRDKYQQILENALTGKGEASDVAITGVEQKAKILVDHAVRQIERMCTYLTNDPRGPLSQHRGYLTQSDLKLRKLFHEDEDQLLSKRMAQERQKRRRSKNEKRLETKRKRETSVDEEPPPTPTPATPLAPMHPSLFGR